MGQEREGVQGEPLSTADSQWLHVAGP